MLTFDAFGGEFKRPGKEQRERQADEHEDGQGLDHPVGRIDQVKGEIRALQGHPAHQGIGDAYPKDVSAFEFC